MCSLQPTCASSSGKEPRDNVDEPWQTALRPSKFEQSMVPWPCTHRTLHECLDGSGGEGLDPMFPGRGEPCQSFQQRPGLDSDTHSVEPVVLLNLLANIMLLVWRSESLSVDDNGQVTVRNSAIGRTVINLGHAGL